jgi:hypothetical protein
MDEKLDHIIGANERVITGANIMSDAIDEVTTKTNKVTKIVDDTNIRL